METDLRLEFSFWSFPQRGFQPNKILALNRVLKEYSDLPSGHLSSNLTSKTFIHKSGYEKARRPSS
ncbi:hypothetical protein DRO64_00480 [Candidatus Bathyarchaeota archaeon]|nr:MAG: hypothetical protein DRO64_00480 [Candidatus Bathyarchaeota archaeon]